MKLGNIGSGERKEDFSLHVLKLAHPFWILPYSCFIMLYMFLC